MFWKVTGFSTPSPIDQILDKDEYTLEELLDEDDLIQECKSLNGRLVAFLRERSTVEQLVRYLVVPPLDTDDPNRTYKYPFTACEVFCCEVEALFNTLLEDAELMGLLFSLLDGPAPLSSKTAGYFGRVVGTLLLRKTNEMMQHFQENVGLLEKLVNHVDTVSIAEIIKRIVGADDQSSILFLPQYAQWLAETQLVDLLLARLSESSSADAQANAADILSAIAHTQPSPLAYKLTNSACISTLFNHAMAPGRTVLVPALDVCIALVEPRRSAQALEATEASMADAVQRAKAEAVDAIVGHLPKLMGLLDVEAHTSTSGNGSSSGAPGQPLTLPSQETPYGVLTPPLGRARLRVVELLAVLLRSGLPSAEAAVMSADAVRICLGLFARYPFNNLLHSQVVGMLVAVLTKASDSMLQYVFEKCKLLEWLTRLPSEVKPPPRAGQEEAAASRAPLRAGYMGHVTQIASTLESFAAQPDSASSSDATTGGPASSSNDSSSPATVSRSSVPSFLSGHAEWQSYVDSVLHPRQELENTARWQCGRPTATELAGLDSDADEFQAEMELEHMVGMQPALYHRYNVDENDEEDEDEEDVGDVDGPFKVSSAYSAQLLTDAISNIDLNDTNPWHDPHNVSMGSENRAAAHGEGAGDDGEGKHQREGRLRSASSAAGRMEDDEVLLATSDDEEPSHGDGGDAMVIVEEDMPEATSTQAEAGAGSQQGGVAISSSSSPAEASTEPAQAAAPQGGGQQADSAPAATVNLVSIRVPGT